MDIILVPSPTSLIYMHDDNILFPRTHGCRDSRVSVS